MPPSPLANDLLGKDDGSANSQVDDSDMGSDPEKGSSSWHSSTNGPSKEESEEKLNLAKKETAAVFGLRILVFIILLLAAVAVSIIVYFVTSNSEKKTYHSEYEGASKKVVETFLDIVGSKLGAISSLGVALTAHGMDHARDWPFVTLSSFQQRATDALSQSQAIYITVNPLVKTTQREMWEQFVVGEGSYWINNGLNFQQEDGLLNFTQSDHLNKTDPLPIWHYQKKVVDGVEYNYTKVIDYGPGPYLPTYQISPILYGGLSVNEDILATEEHSDEGWRAFESQSVVIGKFFSAPPGGIDSEYRDTSMISLLQTAEQKYDAEQLDYEGDPISKVYFPVFGSFGQNRSSVAVMVAWIQWMDYFRNILPDNSQGIFFVLRDSCDGEFTFEIRGNETIFIGRGDFHDKTFNNMKKNATFKNVKDLGDGTKRGIPLNRDQCNIDIDVYPSKRFYGLYNTTTPIIMTVAVAAIFVFTALMFVFYDRLVERRQAVVMEKAAQSNAVVKSLFPENVRERLLEQAANNGKNDKVKDKDSGFLAPNSRLKGYLNGAEEDNINEAPIADLFPHCTVLFADIAGFTAWSSTREPAQVFILLQTVYQAFDKIAKRRKVFKVETIGDSYVAVTGLPEPQPTHAVIMARFAGECKLKMSELVARLENTLGPDTGDLTMRFGLHSGPVTAGVLRGERARFQLFGDTVNTAARMESTGKKDMIQCSISTYSQLVEAGKGNWITPRPDPVQAKGKGFLKTFWLDPTSKKGSSANSANSSSENESAASPTTNATPVRYNRPKTAVAAMKQDRLVNWIVDMLHEHIRKVVALRRPKLKSSRAPVFVPREDQTALQEVAEVIFLPRFDQKAFSEARDQRDIDVGPDVVSQLRNYVSIIASWYHDNPFHNFEHACHVTMATNKFLKRIVAPDISGNESKAAGDVAAKIHQYTHGINSDPLTLLAIVFSALIHDADHRGVSNTQLAKEDKELGEKYGNKSIAEQNSLDIAWDLLMKDDFSTLRSCLFTCDDELQRFRQVLVNVVLATDIFDRELNSLRKKRWDRAFSQTGLKDEAYDDLRATIVIEHIIQASDVSHTMQHWHIYRKWNKRLFQELYFAYMEGRMEKDPSTFWYNGEIGFFENYIIPLAKKLKDCNVFGVCSDECLNYAIQNRDEWKEYGADITEEMMEELANHERVKAAKEKAVPMPVPEPLHGQPETKPEESAQEQAPVMPMTKEQVEAEQAAAAAEAQDEEPEPLPLNKEQVEGEQAMTAEAEEQVPAYLPEPAPLPLTKEQTEASEAMAVEQQEEQVPAHLPEPAPLPLSREQAEAAAAAEEAV